MPEYRLGANQFTGKSYYHSRKTSELSEQTLRGVLVRRKATCCLYIIFFPPFCCQQCQIHSILILIISVNRLIEAQKLFIDYSYEI